METQLVKEKKIEETTYIDFKQCDKVFSLSHTDLDGYGAQVVINHVLLKEVREVEFINADYNAVTEKIKYIIKKIKKDKTKEYVILITDLGLDNEQLDILENFLVENMNVKIQLLDHHETNETDVDNCSWYYMDKENCAAMITYKYFVRLGFTNSGDKWMYDMVKLIQIYDLWEENDIDFGKSNFLANTIFSFLPTYPKVLKRHQIYLYIYVIKEVSIQLSFKSVKEVQREIFDICDRFYSDNIEDIYSIDENMSTEARFYRHIFLLTIPEYRNFERFTLDGKKYKVLYDYGSSFQNVSKYILKELKDIDFIITVHKNMKVSLRGNDSVDVSKIAERYFEGGGHKAASGGYLRVDREEFIRDQRGLEYYFRENF